MWSKECGANVVLMKVGKKFLVELGVLVFEVIEALFHLLVEFEFVGDKKFSNAAKNKFYLFPVGFWVGYFFAGIDDVGRGVGRHNYFG